MKTNLKKKMINFSPELESVSILVSINKIGKISTDIDGFQVIIYGKSFAHDFDVEIVNIHDSNEKKIIHNIMLSLTPGSLWLISGEFILGTEYNVMVLFPNSFQRVNVS